MILAPGVKWLRLMLFKTNICYTYNYLSLIHVILAMFISSRSGRETKLPTKGTKNNNTELAVENCLPNLSQRPLSLHVFPK